MDNKVYPVPFAVALDCLVPVVHPSNPVKSLTKAQLKDIYSGKITNWKQVGGSDSPIVVIGRDTSSGTYGTWQEMIMDKGEKTRVTPKAQTTASSGAMMTAVSQNKNAIGYEGMGYVSKSVKALAVDGVAGTAAGARSGKYPLSRYLFMFTNGWPEGRYPRLHQLHAEPGGTEDSKQHRIRLPSGNEIEKEHGVRFVLQQVRRTLPRESVGNR